MTIIRAELQTTVSYFCVDLHYCCLKYAKISTSFPSLGQAIFRILMLRLLQITFLGVYISKNFRRGIPPDPPRMSHAFGARLHDHSQDAGFATAGYRSYLRRSVMSLFFSWTTLLWCILWKSLSFLKRTYVWRARLNNAVII
jgi:hypothetical protein